MLSTTCFAGVRGEVNLPGPRQQPQAPTVALQLAAAAPLPPQQQQQPADGAAEPQPLFEALLQASAFAIDAVPAEGPAEEANGAAGGKGAPAERRTGSAALERVIGPLRGPLAVARSPQKQRPAPSPAPGSARKPPAPPSSPQQQQQLQQSAFTPPEAVLSPAERELLLIDIGLVCRRRQGALAAAAAEPEAALAASGSTSGKQDAVAVRVKPWPVSYNALVRIVAPPKGSTPALLMMRFPRLSIPLDALASAVTRR